VRAPRRVLETSLYAADLGAAEAFYRDVLGLQRIARVERRHVFFRCGDGVLLVFNPAATAEGGGGIPGHGAVGPGHAAFAVGDDELEAWKDHLATNGVAIESELSWPGGGRSVYFRDPAGNSLELATPATWGLEG
jgi:catechol 2,3-dioxygenase-like lactoylglutathione lyase family enzyme